MTDDHAEWRMLSAAYVLGALDPGERSAFEQHLHDCAVCRSEVVEFSPLPSLLARIEPPDPVDTPRPDLVERTVASARSEVDHLERSRRRWRTAATSLATALVAAVALLVGFALVDDDGNRPGGEPLAIESPATVAGDILADERGWGTHLTVRLEGLPLRDGYQLWAETSDGTREVAASWGPTAGGRSELTGATRFPAAEIRRVLISSTDPDEVLVVARSD